jgi:mannose-1-phosphate guanylyltransferase/mannose-6-phosphate isomerase
MIRPVILSGGAGTRLWPLSTAAQPKQFGHWVPGGSLLVQTLQRLADYPNSSPPFFVTGVDLVEMTLSASRVAGVLPDLVIAEPVGRNTAPAAIVAALCADPDEVLVLLPSDHLIVDKTRFEKAVAEAAVMATQGSIVTFGIVPIRPEIGYGYLEKGPPTGSGFEVANFTEKPDIDRAEQMIADGLHLWNSGMFVVSSSTLLAEAASHCPEVLSGVRDAMTEPVENVMTLGQRFDEVPNISFDYAIMEKTTKGVVMPIDVGWDDVGSYEALWEVSSKDAEGNALSGDVVLVEVEDSYVHAASRKVAIAGVEGLIVIETPDAVLIVPKEKSQLVRDLVTEIEDGTD